MSHTEILTSWIEQPDAFQILAEAQSFFETEKTVRQQFHTSLHEKIKAEFIMVK